MLDLIVSEMFGPTIQGEGPSAGRPAAFVRLGMCNLDCHVCDTPYTWDWSGKLGKKYSKAIELTHRSVEDVARWCEPHQAAGRAIVVTGGEPLLQRKALVPLMELLCSRGPVEVETNGTQAPLPWWHTSLDYNVSPKTSAMLAGAEQRQVPEVLEAFARAGDSARWKFVVACDEDVAEVAHMVQRYEIPWRRVWLMPEGVTAAQLNERLPWLVDVCTSVGANLSHRLHVLAFGTERGR